MNQQHPAPTWDFRVAAQINMYPMDFPHVAHLLEHQLRVWEPMVDRVLVTVDVQRSRSGRYRGSHFTQYLQDLRALLADFAARHPKLEVMEVDHGAEARRTVAQAFFGRDDMPIKAWDGGPFYTYFHGLLHSRARYVVHFDGDMFFGGASRTWVDEGIALFDARPDAMLLSPLPGPPRGDGHLLGQGENGYRTLAPFAGGPAYAFDTVSTRVFMVDLQRLRERLPALPLTPPGAKQRLKSRLLGNPPDVVEAEVLLGRLLRQHGWERVDFLGSAPGLWSLHPPYRSQDFYRRLPELISAVEAGTVADAQRGDYDLNDSMLDWSAQRAANRRHRRLLRLLRDRLLPQR